MSSDILQAHAGAIKAILDKRTDALSQRTHVHDYLRNQIKLRDADLAVVSALITEDMLGHCPWADIERHSLYTWVKGKKITLSDVEFDDIERRYTAALITDHNFYNHLRLSEWRYTSPWYLVNELVKALDDAHVRIDDADVLTATLAILFDHYKEEAGMPDNYPFYQIAITQSNAAFPPKNKTEESPMIPEIKTVTYVDGVDIKKMSDTQLFDRIATLEAEIGRLESIKSKPKKLISTIDELKAAIQAIVALMDGEPTPSAE